MSQLYLQRFEYRAAAKSEFDQAWTIALQTFAKNGHWGGAESGVRHLKSYGTAWGGYVLIEVDDAGTLRALSATSRYELRSHGSNYLRADIRSRCRARTARPPYEDVRDSVARDADQLAEADLDHH